MYSTMQATQYSFIGLQNLFTRGFYEAMHLDIGKDHDIPECLQHIESGHEDFCRLSPPFLTLSPIILRHPYLVLTIVNIY